jgi:hypothetical protein
VTDPTDTAIDRIPLGRHVTYAVRGVPEIADEYNAERTIAPTEISLTYRAAPDSQLGRIHAYVKGWWMQDGTRVPMDKPVGRHFHGDPADWPEWLAEEARLHDPDHATVQPPADRAAHDRTVAYRSPGTRALYCVICARQETGWELVTAAETAEQAVCDFCGGRVLVVAARSLGEAVARYLPEPADRAAVLREAAGRLASQADELWAPGTKAHTVMHADAAELRRMADETPAATQPVPGTSTPAGLARMLAGAAVLSGRHNAAPFDELPPAERERYLTQARQLLARADETQPRCTCQYVAESWIKMGHAAGCPAAAEAQQDGARRG